MSKITKRLIDSLRPVQGRDVFVWDSDLKGFGLRLKPSGAGAFIVQYRNQEGRTRRLRVGRIGTLTPDEARKEARDRLVDATKGRDPSAERHALRDEMTVAELCDWYLRDAQGRVKASTLAMDRSRVECHVRPLLGRRIVRGLTPADLHQFQADIAAGKTADRRPTVGRGGRAKGGGSQWPPAHLGCWGPSWNLGGAGRSPLRTRHEASTKRPVRRAGARRLCAGPAKPKGAGREGESGHQRRVQRPATGIHRLRLVALRERRRGRTRSGEADPTAAHQISQLNCGRG